MVELRIDAKHAMNNLQRTPDNIEKVLKLLRKTERLEERYVALMSNLPVEWNSTSVTTSQDEVDDLETSLFHPGRIDTFQAFFLL